MMEIELPESWRDRALVILSREDGEGSPAEFFAPDEIPSFSLPKRREEWTHARTAAKLLAIRRGLFTDPQTCRIERPRLLVNGAPSDYVSISHSHPYAGAALDSAPVGIDVQVVRELREAAARLFLSDGEETDLRRTQIAHRLIHFWCAKEAAWKQRYGAVTTLRQLPLTLIEERPDGLLFDSVETVIVRDVVVALTRPIS